MTGWRTNKPRRGDRLQHEATGSPTVRDRDTGPGATAPSPLSSRLASELFAQLLLELPGHRRELQSSGRDGDRERLARAAHKLLGAVLYCDLPDLAEALRELKHRCVSGDSERAEAAVLRTIRLIDELLACSGYRGT